MLIKMFSNKTAKMEISIVLLVVFILVLVVSSLFVFSLRKKDAEETLEVYSITEKAYVKEELVKYYVDEIYAKTGDNTEGFNSELAKYKTKDREDFVQFLSSCKDFICNIQYTESNDVVRIRYTFSYDPRNKN